MGVSPAILRAKDLARRMAYNDAPILIQGESGAGKGIFARAIHNASSRAGGPFVPVSCAALRDELLEAELFGSAGADGDGAGSRIGLVECAHRGTLFLDGIEHMSPRMQASLLRMLKEKEITRVGSDKPIKVNVRVLAATNKDLVKEIAEGNFREDLFHRLNVIPVAVPPLKDRLEDIPLLVEHFTARICNEQGIAPKTFDEGAIKALQSREWTGNIRQLRNVIERLIILAGNTITAEDVNMYA